MIKKKSLVIIEDKPINIPCPLVVAPISESHNVQSTHIRVYDDHATLVNPRVAKPICVKKQVVKNLPVASPIKLPPKNIPEKAIITKESSGLLLIYRSSHQSKHPCWKSAATGRGIGLEDQIKAFIDENKIKIKPKKESLVYEPLRIVKTGKSMWDRRFYFINQEGRVDSVSLHFPHGYDIKQMIQEAVDYKEGDEEHFPFVPFVVIKGKDGVLDAVRFIFGEDED